MLSSTTEIESWELLIQHAMIGQEAKEAERGTPKDVTRPGVAKLARLLLGGDGALEPVGNGVSIHLDVD
jgi:hypothetical protein